MAQDRAPLYNFLLLKITHFNCWLSGLTQEAQGPALVMSAQPDAGCRAAAIADLETALLENRAVLGTLALLKRLHWGVESTAALTSWHLAYL
ncbi:hypothetical protein E2I00_007181, partial [Balaenoptera physalus]